MHTLYFMFGGSLCICNYISPILSTSMLYNSDLITYTVCTVPFTINSVSVSSQLLVSVLFIAVCTILLKINFLCRLVLLLLDWKIVTLQKLCLEHFTCYKVLYYQQTSSYVRQNYYAYVMRESWYDAGSLSMTFDGSHTEKQWPP